MKIKKLLGKTVLVYIDPKRKQKEDSRILIPDSIPNSTGIVEAEVLYVGNGAFINPKTQGVSIFEMPIKPGDKVLVNGSFGTPMKVDEKMCKLYNYDDIIALLS